MAEKEKSKKAFVLRLNPDLLGELEKWAADDFRSVNGQIEFLLSRAVQEQRKKRIDSKPKSKEKNESEI